MATEPVSSSDALSTEELLPRLLDALDALPAEFTLGLLDSGSVVEPAAEQRRDGSLFSEIETELLLATLEDAPLNTAEPPTTSKKKVPTRVRQQQEMEYLRAQVAELEGELERIKHTQVASVSPSTNSVLTSTADTSSALWEQIAKRQTEQKRQADIENTKLRSLVEDQLRVAQSLQKLLTKRSLAEANEYFEPHKRLRVSTLDQVLGPFTPHLDRQLRSLDQVLASCGLAQVAQVELDDAHMKYDDHNEIFLERTMTKVFPFDVDRVGEAMWRRFTPTRLDVRNGFYGASKRSENEYDIHFSVETRVRRSAAQSVGEGMGIRQRTPGKRYVIVWQMRTQFTGAAFSRGAAGMHNFGYLAVEPVGGFSSSSLSVVKVCARLYPQLAESVKIQTGLLVDLTLSSFDPNTKMILQLVENDLLEQAVKSEHTD